MRSRKNLTSLGIVLCFICAVSACKTSQDSSGDLITIDVEKAYDDPMRDLMLSEIVEDIEYVKLETSPSCYISEYAREVAISQNYLIIFDSDQNRILLFSKNGEYLNDIGSYGKGPGEYSYASNFSISPNEKLVVLRGDSKTYMVFSINGEFISEYKFPLLALGNSGFLDNGSFAIFQQTYWWPNETGFQLLLLDDQLTHASDSLLFNHKDTTRIRGMGYEIDNFSLFQNNMYYRQHLQDTIFRIVDNIVEPYLLFKLGNLRLPDNNVPMNESMKKYLIPQVMNFFQEFGYIRFMGSTNDLYGNELLVWNKTNDDFYFVKHPKNGGVYLNTRTPFPKNDIDGLQIENFFDQISGNASISQLNITTVKPYIESDSVALSSLATQKYYNRLKKLLDESDLEDNPIIRICYLK